MFPEEAPVPKKLTALGGVLFLGILIAASVATADPCLMVYSDGPGIYHYDPAEYYTVTFGDPLYEAAYDRGGEVLIDINTNEIAFDVYQAPGLAGFQVDAEDQGFFIIGNDFNLIVDGFNNAPTTYENILIVFDRIEPDGCVPMILIDGNPALFDAQLGFYYPIGDLVVSTPAQGNNYSDTVMHAIHWENCAGVRIWAFADADHDLDNDAQECFSAFSHDLTVPTESRTWGGIKEIYRSE